MAQLAIKGHTTRGKEVIEILEMLGGENEYKLNGCNIECAYYKRNGVIRNTATVGFNNIKLLTLEEFLEKFPYKVGDKVKNARINDFVGRIIDARWDNNEEQVIYCVEWDDEIKSKLSYFAKVLQPYKEETMENLTIQDIRDNNAEWFLNKLQEMSAEGALQTISDLYDELHTPQYPKTYEECCEVIGAQQNRHYFYTIRDKQDYPHEVAIMDSLDHLRQLLICRDAYWKIIGEQMGLGKPWKPDWSNLSATSHDFIKINNGRFIYSSRVLVFPTSEICDTFYENFKDLIEQCKELL